MSDGKGRWRRDFRPSYFEIVNEDATDQSDVSSIKTIKNQAVAFALKVLKSESVRYDATLMKDMVSVFEGNSIYLPNFFCSNSNLELFNSLKNELQQYAQTVDGDGLVHWSKHSKHENPEFSGTFNMIVKELAEYFDLEVYQTRLNFYKDGQDWKPFHHDSHAFGNKEEDFTAGASFGDARELQFLHPRSGALFGFPQNNGDIFAFSKDVNRRFQHGVPRSSKGCGPRMSIIVWGKRKSFNGNNGSSRSDASIPVSDSYYK